MKRAFKLATIFNIPVEINYSWFIVVGLIIFTLTQGYFPNTDPGLEPIIYWLMAIISASCLFASLLAHELAHSIVAKRNQLPIHGITLFIFGGVAHMSQEPSSPAVEFKMAIAGPAMSFFLALLFFGLDTILASLGVSGPITSMVQYLFIINVFVGLFNLIPGFPLDGGRILRSILWHFYRDVRKATAIASGFGKTFALLLMLFGLLNLFHNNLLSGIWLIFIGFFLQEAADTSYRQVVLKKILSGLRVEQFISKNVITVPANTTLEALVNDYIFNYRHHSFPVIKDDQLLGLVTFHDVKEVSRDKWNTTTVNEIMVPISDSFIINKNLDAMDALTKLVQNGLGRVLVIEQGKLIGILSQKDIMQLFQLRTEIEK